MTASMTEASTRSVRTSAATPDDALAGAASVNRSGTPSRSATTRHERPETAWARMHQGS